MDGHGAMAGTSINDVSIDQLQIACRHVLELMAAGLTENMSIRTLELLADVHAKRFCGGSATPHHVDQVEPVDWSLAALAVRGENPHGLPKDLFRVEHGTPRRAFARMVLRLHKDGDLSEASTGKLVKKYWRLAVITIDEDRRLNRIARSTPFDDPMQRWTAAGIKFARPESSLSPSVADQLAIALLADHDPTPDV